MTLNERIIKILEAGEVKKGEAVRFSDEARELIHETAKECRKTKIYQENIDKQKSYEEGLTAAEVYLDMCNKIINAPTILHMQLVPIMLIPVIDDKLQGKCDLGCTEGMDYCCICCPKKDECTAQCDYLDSYEYTEECRHYRGENNNGEHKCDLQ